ncbi:MAG: hypothetical protein J6Q54_08810, partial [Oscillospiraceae bacterium]|nr:hypothetical protein [Oscillospiraceae bacterium]
MNNSKLISLLLVLAMVLSMVVLPVAAVEEAPEAPEATETTEATEATEPAEPTDCPQHAEAEWTKVTAADWAAGKALTTGHYFLTENVDLTAALTVAAGETVCIDLAGKNLTQTTAFVENITESHRVLEVTGGTLTVMDSVGTGVISGGWTSAKAGASLKAFGGNVYLVEGATFNLYGGTISGGKVNRHGIGNAATYGGNIYASASTVNIFGGTVADGVASSGYTNTNSNANRDASLHGGNISVNESVLNISGGTITGGKVEHNFACKLSQGTFSAAGGNIHIYKTTVVISGGTISNGSVITNNQGVDITKEGTTYDTLTSNAYGGNIAVYGSASTLTISGGKIQNGTVSASATAYGDGTMTNCVATARGGNLYIDAGTVTISGGKLTGGTTTATGNKEPLCHGGNIYNSSDLIITGGTISGGVSEYGGAVYTKGDIDMSSGEITGGVAMAGSKTPAEYFKLNNEISRAGNLYVYSGTVTMSGNAKITDGCTYYRGGNLYIAGGTVIMKDDSVISGGYNYFAALAGSKGKVSIEATEELPAVEGSVSAEYGGNVYNMGTLKIYDNAQIKNGVAARGGNYSSSPSTGKLYMYGGAIFGGNALQGEASDDVKVGNKANCVFEMYAGVVQQFKDDGDANVISIYNGTITSDKEIVPACEKIHVSGNHYWHAAGTCAACGHTFATPGEETACTTCETIHVTTGGLHTYESGICTICGYAEAARGDYDCGCENAEWTAWDGQTLANGGHYYLTGDLQLSAELKLAEKDAVVCIDLNGYTLTAAPGERAFNLPKDTFCTLQIMNGTIQGGGVAVNGTGGIANVGYDATLICYDLTAQNGLTADAKAGGNFYVNGNLVMTGCVIRNGKIDNDKVGNGADGGNFAVYGSASSLELQSCQVMDGDVTTVGNAYGGNIYCGTNANITIMDTSITGGRANDGGNIFLMNSTAGGHAYFYGENEVKDAFEGVVNGFYIYGSKDYISNVYIFGGYFEDVKEKGTYNEIFIASGSFNVDPATLDAVIECGCVTFNEETGIYTVSHADVECEICKSKANRDPVNYSNIGGHTYTDSTLCDNCALVTATIGE